MASETLITANAVDYLILAVYFCFVLGIGFLAKRQVSNSVGSLPAWVTGLASSRPTSAPSRSWGCPPPAPRLACRRSTTSGWGRSRRCCSSCYRRTVPLAGLALVLVIALNVAF